MHECQQHEEIFPSTLATQYSSLHELCIIFAFSLGIPIFGQIHTILWSFIRSSITPVLTVLESSIFVIMISIMILLRQSSLLVD